MFPYLIESAYQGNRYAQFKFHSETIDSVTISLSTPGIYPDRTAGCYRYYSHFGRHAFARLSQGEGSGPFGRGSKWMQTDHVEFAYVWFR